MIALLVEPNMADCGIVRVVLFVGFVCLSSVVFAQESQERNISIVEYSCDPKRYPKLCMDKNYSIVHVVAESIDKRSAIHYLWSVVYSPTIIVAYFETTDVNITVDWGKVLNGTATGGISFSVQSKYITAMVIPAIYEFQDPKDELFYTEGKQINGIVKHPFHSASVYWDKPDIDHKNNITTFKASMLGGDVTFQCNASFDQGRESVLPQQQFSSNSTVFTLNLSNLTELNKTGHTRFIFELHSFTADNTESTTCVKADKSIDDEFSPAVFKTIVVNSTGSGRTSYSAWKPVAYVDKKRSLENQVPSHAYYKNVHHFISQDCRPLPPYSFFRPLFSIAYSLEGTHFLSYGMNISFGQQKDGWYDGRESTRFLSWSAVVGYGTPPTDKLSTVVLIIIIVGFGAPLLLIVITIVYVIAKKLKAKKATSSYGMIN